MSRPSTLVLCCPLCGANAYGFRVRLVPQMHGPDHSNEPGHEDDRLKGVTHDYQCPTAGCGYAENWPIPWEAPPT